MGKRLTPSKKSLQKMALDKMLEKKGMQHFNMFVNKNIVLTHFNILLNEFPDPLDKLNFIKRKYEQIMNDLPINVRNIISESH